MHKPLPVLAIMALIFAGAPGCSEKPESKQSIVSKNSVPVTQTSQQDSQTAFSKTFSGNIDGKFGITMNLTRKGNLLSGTYYYNKVKQPIAVSGEINADGILTLEERDTRGVVTGIFEGTLFSDKELTGKWTKPDSNKQLRFSLKAADTAAQSVTGVDVVEHSFSLQGKENMVADFSFPLVKGNMDAAVLKNINQQLSVQRLTDETEEAIRKNFAECSCGLVNSSFVVNYNKSSILSITVVYEWLGAYPSFSSKYININTQSGEPLQIEQLLKAYSLGELATQADKILQERIAETKKEAAGTDEAEWAEELLAGKKFEKANLQNFTVHDNGITFYYPFGFPHAAIALEPDGAIGFSFEQMANYIDPKGLLAVGKK
jgi:hypothetical protein